jgi:hypothetical protein
MKNFSSVILSERSESKDPYAAHSLSTRTFFDGAERRAPSVAKLFTKPNGSARIGVLRLVAALLAQDDKNQ